MSRTQRFVGIPPSLNATNKFIENITKVLNGNINFGTTFTNPVGGGSPGSATSNDANIECWKATGTTPGAANTEFAVAHNIGGPRLPLFFFYFLDRAGQLYSMYAGMTPWTAATNAAMGDIYLKCTVASANYWVIVV